MFLGIASSWIHRVNRVKLYFFMQRVRRGWALRRWALRRWAPPSLKLRRMRTESVSAERVRTENMRTGNMSSSFAKATEDESPFAEASGDKKWVILYCKIYRDYLSLKWAFFGLLRILSSACRRFYGPYICLNQLPGFPAQPLTPKGEHRPQKKLQPESLTKLQAISARRQKGTNVCPSCGWGIFLMPNLILPNKP